MKILLIVPTLSVLLISCNACSTDIQNTEQKQDINSSIQDIDNKAIKKEASTEVKEDTMVLESLVEWEPRMIRTPTSAPHKDFYLPDSNVQKIKPYLYNDIDINRIKEKYLDENNYIFRGYVQYFDNTTIDYSFKKDKSGYSGTEFYLAGNYELSIAFSEFNKNIIYKMLEISGAENPKVFFQELVDSPKITKYTGCTVQLKEVKYGVIDLTSCKEDDATVIALYNPELE